jgi:hypothetical protein
MTYLVQNEIANNQTMLNRVASCAAQEGVPMEADVWSWQQRLTWAAAPGWDAAWESARAGHPDDPDFDPGADEAVITDAMILAAVQPMVQVPGNQS